MLPIKFCATSIENSLLCFYFYAAVLISKFIMLNVMPCERFVLRNMDCFIRVLVQKIFVW